MKKGFSVFLVLFFLFPVFSTSIPQQLLGIWEGKDRYVFFEQQPENENPDFFNGFIPKENPQLVIIFKEYYGWYLDRAAEPEKYAEKEIRSPNAATHKNAEHIPFEIINYNQNTDGSSSFEMVTTFSRHEKNYVPVALLEDKLFIDFYKRLPDETEDSESNKLKKDDSTSGENGYWLGNINTRGITINPQPVDENIGLFVIDGKKMYDIRYWLSDVEERDERDKSVIFSFEDDEYIVPKYLYAANNQYTCVRGRAKRIRNAQKYRDFNAGNYYINADKNLMANKNNEYLVKLLDKDDFEDLMNIVKTANSRRKPDPPPLFPPKELDWHWDLIDYLEKNNELIQKVRERQKAFGPRGKDLNPQR